MVLKIQKSYSVNEGGAIKMKTKVHFPFIYFYGKHGDGSFASFSLEKTKRF